MRRTCVAIPTLSAYATLKPLVLSLLEDPEVDAVLILDNGHRGGNAKTWFRQIARRDARVTIVAAHRWGIHRMWNYGREWAAAHGFEFYAALNDDITVPPLLITEIARAMRARSEIWIASPEWTRPLSAGVDVTGTVRHVRGTQRHGGIAGWCWMLRLDAPVPLVDEGFQWWYGDDDLAEQVHRAGGHLGIVEGLPLDHAQETTARKHAWTRKAIEADGILYEQKYGPGTAIPMRVSVLIPTMNRPDRLRAAVRAVLAQDHPSFEVIVQNGGLELSLGGADDPLLDDRVLLRTVADKGICDALNRAADLATGDVWHVACDDDEMRPGTLWSAQCALRTGEQWTYGWMRTFREWSNGKRQQVARPSARLWPWNLDEHKAANSINQPTAFFTRESYEKLGPFHEDFPMCWDYEWWMRLGVRYEPVQRDHCDSDYVIWPGSTSVHAAKAMVEEVARLQDLWARVGYGDR